jgi:hypothetical protein
MGELKNGKYGNQFGTFWFKDDKLHREDGPAMVCSDEAEEWFFNGVHHREDGPAKTWPNGGKEWWQHGVRHREDSHAFEYPNRSKEWWINGTKLTEEEFDQWLVKKSLNEKLHSTLPPKPTSKRGKI